MTDVARGQPSDAERLGERHDRSVDETQPEIREVPAHAVAENPADQAAEHQARRPARVKDVHVWVRLFGNSVETSGFAPASSVAHDVRYRSGIR